MRCTYCYYSAVPFNSGHKTGKEAKDVDAKRGNIEQLKDWTLQAIALDAKEFLVSGGEPLTYPRLFDYLKFLEENKIHYILFTNGTLINRNIDWIKSLKNLSEIRLSLDGFHAQEKLRGKGTTNIVIDALKALSKANIKVSVNTVLTKENVAELDLLYQLFKSPELSVDKWRIDIPLPSGRAHDVYKNLMPEWTEIEKAYKDLIVRCYKEKPKFRIRILNVFDSIWLNERFMQTALLNKFSPNDHPCSYYFGGITVEYDGQVKWCPSLPLTFGNLNDNKLKYLLSKRNPAMRDFLNLKVSDIKECNGCKYLPLCGGGCRAYSFLLTNNLLSKDSVSCKMMSFIEGTVLPLVPDLQKMITNIFT